MLINQKRYEEAEKIGENFTDDPTIQSQILRMNVVRGEYEKANKIGEKFPDNTEIQSQMIIMYMKKGEYEKVWKIGERFSNNATIQSQILAIHIQRKEYELAKKIGKMFPKALIIQYAMLSMYIKIGEYEEAEAICEKFPDDPTVQSKKAIILQRKQAKKVEENIQKEPMVNLNDNNMFKQSIRGILIKIYSNPNDSTINEQIEQVEDKWTRLVLHSALADKLNIKAPAQQFIKQLKKQGYVDEEHKVIISGLEQRLQQKRKFFDVGFYDDLVGIMLKKQNNDDIQLTSQYDDGRG